ncbi:Metallo-dependent phosphatase-like protein [Rhodocollybia butyracea]|uniref:Metallo-dependent phosphatase-like protein n=1 Tax=Rhodocollybia butyracea TaxID=206335 RepID=A0A9P5P3R3_9AGAR|nr:Metallo-dependent phosphatase-like protein [Rhodocollybia butyracea]
MYRFFRSLRSMCAPITAFIGFSCLLTFIFILYQPTPGPGIKQRLGWQSWDSISMNSDDLATVSSNTSSQAAEPHVDLPEGVDWWNVSGLPGTGQDTVNTTSLPLDVWLPTAPHDTGLSEISIVHCYMDPQLAGDLCAPSTTPEKDAIRGPWVRVERNLNLESGYLSGYLSIFYRRTRRLDINLIDSIRLFSPDETPVPPEGWTKVDKSVRTGIYHAPPLFLWYHVGKTAGDMSTEEKNQLITEIDVLYGDDVPWWGFERLQSATTPKVEGRTVSTYITIRKGVKPVPKAPPLHFSRDGKFKILQIADLHYSVSVGRCRDIRPNSALYTNCDAPDGPGSDNLSSTLLAHMLDVEKPDLVVFTGDQLNGQETSWDPKSVLAKFAKEVWGRGIPWAAIFGNHDSEDGLGREDQMTLLEAMPYSLSQRGPKDVHGVGNYVLAVRSADPSMTHLLTLYFLDSGDYSKGFYNFWGMFTPTAYDWIRQDQIDWFLRESSKIQMIERPFTPDGAKDISSIHWSRQTDQLTPQTRRLARPNALAFFHMPLPEAYNAPDKNPDTNWPLDKGLSGLEPNGNAQGNDGFFEKALLATTESDHVNSQAQGAGQGPRQEVKVVANGHCHITENCRRIKGVWMCFGGGGSYSGYGKIGFDRRFRVFEISEYGEKIRTWKRTEGTDAAPDGTVMDDMVLVGPGAPSY